MPSLHGNLRHRVSAPTVWAHPQLPAFRQHQFGAQASEVDFALIE